MPVDEDQQGEVVQVAVSANRPDLPLVLPYDWIGVQFGFIMIFAMGVWRSHWVPHARDLRRELRAAARGE